MIAYESSFRCFSSLHSKKTVAREKQQCTLSNTHDIWLAVWFIIFMLQYLSFYRNSNHSNTIRLLENAIEPNYNMAYIIWANINDSPSNFIICIICTGTSDAQADILFRILFVLKLVLFSFFLYLYWPFKKSHIITRYTFTERTIHMYDYLFWIWLYLCLSVRWFVLFNVCIGNWEKQTKWMSEYIFFTSYWAMHLPFFPVFH